MFGSLMGDFEDDPIFGHHMRSMRQMNNMMSSMFGDPFGAFDALTGGGAAAGFGPQQNHQQAMGLMGGGLMPFGFPAMPNMNRLLSGEGMEGPSFCSSSVITMSHGPDGRPQVYQATSSTKTGPGGIRETQKTVQDSRTGVKKMAIGHHIGERAHIIEREQNYHSGQHEERQDFINLEEDEAEDFDREFTQKSRQGSRFAISEVGGSSAGRRQMPAIMPAEQHNSSSTSKNTNAEEAEPNVTMPPSPPPPMSSSAAGSHSRRGMRPEKHTTQYSHKNQTRANLATPRRPLRTPISSPLTMSSGLNIFMSPRTSIHPHPYNNVSPQSRRTHHRQMKDRSQHVVNNHPQHHVQIEELPDDYDEGAPHNSRQ